jgi:hypothetical protein
MKPGLGTQQIECMVSVSNISWSYWFSSESVALILCTTVILWIQVQQFCSMSRWWRRHNSHASRAKGLLRFFQSYQFCIVVPMVAYSLHMLLFCLHRILLLRIVSCICKLIYLEQAHQDSVIWICETFVECVFSICIGCYCGILIAVTTGINLLWQRRYGCLSQSISLQLGSSQ